jgi:hypothetical protein
MGSMGFFLCDWSVEFLRYRAQKKKAKKQRQKEAEECQHKQDLSIQTEACDESCMSCSEKSQELTEVNKTLTQYESEKTRLSQLFGSESDIFSSVESVLKEAAEKKSEMDKLRVENVQLAEDVAVQLRERDKAHSERVRSLEIVMNEKEKQLLQSSNVMRQQLASAKLESQQLQKQIETSDCKQRRMDSENLEQELESMLVVIDLKKEENDQLRAANNSLQIDLERYSGLEIQLQVEKQKVEEMNSVIKMKNEQLRQVLDEYDSVQHQLEIEVAAHMSCQQDLEKIQWDKENFLMENEKRWKELQNQKKSGLILDVVRKDKAVAYSFNC